MRRPASRRPSPAGSPGTWTASSGRCATPGSRSASARPSTPREILTRRRPARPRAAAARAGRGAAAAGGPAADLRRAVRPVVAAVGPAAARPATDDADGDGRRAGGVHARRAGLDDADLSRADARRSCCSCCSTATRRRCAGSPARPSSCSARGQPSPSGQSFFSYRVLRALSPDTLVAQLLAGLLAEGDRGGLAEQVARQTVTRAADRVPGGDRGGGAPADGGGEGPGQGRQERDPPARRPGRLPAGPVRRPRRAAAGGGPAGPPAGGPAVRAAPARPRGPAGLPQDRARLAGHRRRARSSPTTGRARCTSRSSSCSATSAARWPASATSR